ncbi:MAG: hypothetical protein ACI9JD_000137 [Rhodococcus sp. (in: high G+C Gram-positive bacteria)]
MGRISMAVEERVQPDVPVREASVVLFLTERGMLPISIESRIH